MLLSLAEDGDVIAQSFAAQLFLKSSKFTPQDVPKAYQYCKNFAKWIQVILVIWSIT